MAGITDAVSQAALDYLFPTTGASDYIQYSANGTTETASLTGTSIGATGWAAATAADPSVKANNAVLTSAAASGAVTVSHFRIATAASGGTGRTDWTALGASKVLASGDKVEWAIGACQVTLT